MKTIILSIILIASSIFLKKPVFLGILMSVLLIYIENILKGYSYRLLNKSMLKSILSSKNVLIILSLIGILTSMWMVCGTIPYLMHLGLNLLKNYNFIFVSFIIMSIISYILGTAVGSISTIGLVIMAIGKSIGINTSILAGSIISGAFLGDRSSPLSSALNLTVQMTNAQLHNAIKKMNTTLIPAFIISGFLYYILGMSYSRINTIHINSSLKIITENFNINIICLIPLVILFTCILLKLNIVISILTSIISSFTIAIFVQNINITNLIKISLFGFNSSNNSVQSIVHGGGFLSMSNVLLTIIVATAFTGLLEELNLLNPLVSRITKSINNTYTLILKCGLLSMLLNTITCNQTIGIIIPSKFMKYSFKESQLTNEHLAHCISDTGTITVPLIPWNINSIVASTILGVHSINFIPYSFLCYLIPITFIIKYKIHFKNKYIENIK